MLELLGGFLAVLVSAVPDAVNNWIEGRNAVRIEQMRRQFDIEASERKVRVARQLHRVQLEHQMAERYPLGVPGRLTAVLPATPLPTILVSPPPRPCPFGLADVADEVVDALRQVPGVAQYATLPTGAFVRDQGMPRWVDGEIGARTVAAAEFATGRPAVIVYFEAGRHSVTAHAFLSTVFDATRGENSFSYTIARYGYGGASIVARDADLPSWHHIDLGAFDRDTPADIVAATVSWFLLSVVDSYWQLTVGVTPGLLRSVVDSMVGDTAGSVASGPVGGSIGGAVGGSDVPPGSDVVRIAEREAATLASRGYAVTAELVGMSAIGLTIDGPRTVVVVLDADYPASPPVAVLADGEHIELSPQDWSPGRSLIDVVEALHD